MLESSPLKGRVRRAWRHNRTCSCAANVAAVLTMGTLNAKTVAPTLFASWMSDSLIDPTDERTILSSTLEVGKWRSPSPTASSDPAESALRMVGTSLLVRRRWPRRGASSARDTTSALSFRNSATSLARASDWTTSNSSPAEGSSRNPLILTGNDGPAAWIGRPISFASTLTFPHVLPITT
eukprot:scaffold215682_cov35-Tisochrysis_lutea.AAC.2